MTLIKPTLDVEALAQTIQKMAIQLDKVESLLRKDFQERVKEWYTVSEAAKVLGCSRTYVHQLAKRGELKSYQHESRKGEGGKRGSQLYVLASQVLDMAALKKGR